MSSSQNCASPPSKAGNNDGGNGKHASSDRKTSGNRADYNRKRKSNEFRKSPGVTQNEGGGPGRDREFEQSSNSGHGQSPSNGKKHHHHDQIGPNHDRNVNNHNWRKQKNYDNRQFDNHRDTRYKWARDDHFHGRRFNRNEYYGRNNRHFNNYVGNNNRNQHWKNRNWEHTGEGYADRFPRRCDARNSEGNFNEFGRSFENRSSFGNSSRNCESEVFGAQGEVERGSFCEAERSNSSNTQGGFECDDSAEFCPYPNIVKDFNNLESEVREEQTLKGLEPSPVENEHNLQQTLRPYPKLFDHLNNLESEVREEQTLERSPVENVHNLQQTLVCSQPSPVENINNLESEAHVKQEVTEDTQGVATTPSEDSSFNTNKEPTPTKNTLNNKPKKAVLKGAVRVFKPNLGNSRVKRSSESSISTQAQPGRKSKKHSESEVPAAPIAEPTAPEEPAKPPKIFLAPISSLIKEELQGIYTALQVEDLEPTPDNTTDDPESLSRELVSRVSRMDMISIKNVINSPASKFDAALKLQARKRLGEELRKQLEASNQECLSNIVDDEPANIVPDAMVDAMNIPELLDHIRKALGIEFLEDTGLEFATSNVVGQAEITEITHEKAAEEVAVQKGVPLEQVPKPISESKAESKSSDLMSRIRNLEIIKSAQVDIPQKKKSTEPDVIEISPEKQRPMPAPAPAKTTLPKSSINNNKKRKKSVKPKPAGEILVISTSGSSSSDSSDSSSSDSDSSSSSNSSGSSSSSSKRKRRMKKLSEENVVQNFKNLILPNLPSAQRRRFEEKYSKTTFGSLTFICELCTRNKNSKLNAKEKKSLKANLKSSNNEEALRFLMKNILDLVKENRQKKESRKKVAGGGRWRKANSADDDSANRISSTVKINASNPIESIRHRYNKSETAHSAEGVATTSTSTTGGNWGGIGGNRHQTKSDNVFSVSDTDGVSDNDRLHCRSWKSPGEKKCIQEPDYSQLPALPSTDLLEAQNLRLIESMQQKNASEDLLARLKELDLRLMEAHRRKIYIDDMILKLQRDKMEADLTAMQLQNEKFLLLNTAVAQKAFKAESEEQPRKKRKPDSDDKPEPFSTPFSQKLIDRKKRCQRDILIEDAFNTIQSSGIINSDGMGRIKTRSSTSLLQSPSKFPITVESEDEDEPQKAEDYDYTGVTSGMFEGFKLPITQVNIIGEYVVAASEDGNLYKFSIRTKELLSKFSKHTEVVTQVVVDSKKFIYSTSLDGYLKKTSLDNFGLELQSVDIREPIQSFDIQWDTAFLGSRWGNIFTYNLMNSKLSQTLLCSVGSSVIAIKAAKEGPRRILIVSSKGHEINIRDARTGLLLRSLDIPNHLNVNALLMSHCQLFCATQKNQIYQFDFSTGKNLSILNCGNGVASMKLYKEKFIVVGCFDGFIYVLDKNTTCQIGRFPGAGKMILSMDIAGDKLITSAKDNSMQLIDMPEYIVARSTPSQSQGNQSI